MAKMCPECQREFKRRKKGACPHCQTPLFFDSNKKARRESDKELVSLYLEELGKTIRKYRGTWYPMEKDSADRKAGYQTVDKVRDWLNKNDEYDMEHKMFILELLRYVMGEVWWVENVKSARQLNKQMVRKAPVVYNKKKEKLIREMAEKRRTKKGEIEIEFGL